MAIHLNLLAEAQALEELRRRDPVKRAIWVGALLVVVVLVWSSSLWVRAMRIKGEMAGLQAGLDSRSKEYDSVQANRKQLDAVRGKLAALQELATNRFLNGNLLDALQHATLPNVQLTQLRVAQTYDRVAETKAKTNDTHVVAGKPATVTEKILLTLDAKDSSPVPGDSVTKFKQALAESPYFKRQLAKADDVRLKDLGTPQTGPDGKSFVLFSIECRYPEKTR